MKQDTVMQNADKRNSKYVFVCGLPRSGTSLLGRNIARMTDCTGFQNTGVLQDDGRFLQDVYQAKLQLGKDAELMGSIGDNIFPEKNARGC
jgi:hypothetical protein